METSKQVGVLNQGQLLVATPFVHEMPYYRAVVLLMRQTDRGSFGLVLNTELPTVLAELGAYMQAGGALGNRHQANKEPWQLFRGCVVWTPGQLERELEKGIWISTRAQLDPRVIKRDLWGGLLRQIGQSVLHETLRIERFAVDPQLN